MLVGHEDAVSCCSIADDERIVVSGAADKAVIVWEVDTGDILHTLDGHRHSVITAVGVSSDGSVAFSGTNSSSNFPFLSRYLQWLYWCAVVFLTLCSQFQ